MSVFLDQRGAKAGIARLVVVSVIEAAVGAASGAASLVRSLPLQPR